MLTHDLRRFSAIITQIADLYGKEMSEVTTNLYWHSLKRFELNELETAFQKHLNDPARGMFFPKPADLIRWIEKDSVTLALLAWSKVEKAIRKVGTYRNLAFDDALIHASIEAMGGWVKLCGTTLDALPFRAREFQQYYQNFMDHPPKHYPPYLRGLNGQCGNRLHPKSAAPALTWVGDIEKAKAIAQNAGHTVSTHTLPKESSDDAKR